MHGMPECTDVSCSLFYRITYKDRHNQTVANKLLKEVKSLNPEYLTEHIKGIAIDNKTIFAYT